MSVVNDAVQDKSTSNHSHDDLRESYVLKPWNTASHLYAMFNILKQCQFDILIFVVGLNLWALIIPN